MILTFSGNIEAVDSGERRTISGKIAPYGEVGFTSAGRLFLRLAQLALQSQVK